MSNLILTNELIYKSFIIGAKNVISEKNGLNAINVFPVPDGDTGSNLASMMTTIIEKARLGKTSEETMQSIADAAIVGARGNSGIIFAQYIYGFSMAVKEDDITPEKFVQIVENASNQAYKAIAKPVEGTMITLMRQFAKTLSTLKNASRSFIDLLSKAYESLKEDLAKTPDLLPILKENKVVDAGAKGFVHFVEGFIKAFKGEDVVMTHEHEHIEEMHVDHLEDSEYRYCTEALVRGENLNVERIKSDLIVFGNSLVVAGTNRTVRIHIHTNEPEHVFSYFDGYAKIIEQKVDDMKRQFETANKRKYPIALVTDSIADLPSEMIEKYQIHMVPLNLMIDDQNYFDKLTIHNDRFYQIMDAQGVYPTSSQPNVKSLENLYSFLTTYYDEVIVMTVSQKMSGTYQAFVEASKAFPDKKIYVINSKQNSGAEGLLVMKAAEMIDQGKSFDEVIQGVEALIPHSRILVSVKTLKYMIRSGRLKKAKKVVAQALNLKPIISIDEHGEGIIFDKGFNIKTADKKILSFMKKIHDESGIVDYAIVHAKALDRVEQYEKALTEMLGKKPTYVMEISTIVAMNAGIGSVAVAYIKGEK
ncbi:MAG: DegV family EDD domain-containing protein [Bacillota bacterium]|nr:MAG: DegV family EDD domain-containing protein [Bacillota bacterium]